MKGVFVIAIAITLLFLGTSFSSGLSHSSSNRVLRQVCDPPTPKCDNPCEIRTTYGGCKVDFDCRLRRRRYRLERESSRGRGCYSNLGRNPYDHNYDHNRNWNMDYLVPATPVPPEVIFRAPYRSCGHCMVLMPDGDCKPDHSCGGGFWPQNT